MLNLRRLVVALVWWTLLVPGIVRSATLTSVVVSNVQNESSCDAGPAYSTFSPTDAQVVIYLKISDMQAGDALRAEWVRPNGTIASNASWQPLAEGGSWCFRTRLNIAGTTVATTPGAWKVRIYLNNVLLTTPNFTITEAGTGGVAGSNLILNGDAESGPESCYTGAASIPGWSTDGIVAVCSYALGDDFPTPASPGPPNRGTYFFAGGPTTGASHMTQQIDVSALAAQIDTGTYSYTLSAYLGGYISQGDNAMVTLAFQGSFSSQLGTAVIGPVTAAQRSSTTGMILRTVTGTLPTGTRTILVKVDFDWEDGNYNDGYVDDISLILGSGGTGGGTPGCDYFINPQTQSVPAAGYSGFVLVSTTSGCEVTATSNVSWIVVDAVGSSGVSYTVQPNSSATPRSGTITIANRTFTVNQEGAPACTYSISPTSANVGSSGGTGSVSVMASGSSCSWSASSNDNWITITSGSSGTGNGSVSYSVSGNSDTVTRTGSLTAAGKTFTVSQDAGGSAGGGPQLSGAVNAASYTPSDLPGGGLAQGSFFSLFGANIGPEQWQQATSFPLPTTAGLGGVVVQIRQGGTVVTCPLHFASKSQINGIIPSNAPLGDAEMVVIYQGQEARVAVKIVKHNFGIFALQAGRGPGIVQNWNSAADVPLNTTSNPARPGQIGVIWGTGLGPITAPDNQAPPAGNLPFNVKVAVAGRDVKLLYWGRAPGAAGVDNVYIELPADIQQGCHVPVQVEVENTYSNTVTMAIGEPGMDCSAGSDIPFIGLANEGGKTGVIVLLRASIDAEIEAENEQAVDRLDLEGEIGLGLFVDVPPYDTSSNDLLGLLPLMGTCQSTATRQFDLSTLLEDLGGIDIFGGLSGDDLPDGVEQPEYQGLDAGTGFSISGPAGKRLFEVDEETPGVYVGLLGGRVRAVPEDMSLITAFLPAPFLDGGSYRLQLPGGSQVGPVDKQFSLMTPVTMVSPPDTINRSSGVTINWSGSTGNQAVVIFGMGANQNTDTVGGFVCVESGSKSSFHVPASHTSTLPLASPVAGFDDNGAALGIAVMPVDNIIEFQATGLDRGLIVDGSIDLKTVGVK